jgi:hypothetical protein
MNLSGPTTNDLQICQGKYACGPIRAARQEATDERKMHAYEN